MIIVRDVFHIEPEQMKAAKEILREHRGIAKRLGYQIGRVMIDLTGDYYTLVLESDFTSLSQYEGALKAIFADAAWQESYGRLRKMIRGGRREIYTLVE